MEFLGDITGLDPNRPSLLELIAQEQLRDTLQPAIKHYLKVHGASFAENFYGLKRRRTPAVETVRVNAVGIPYLRAKAHQYYEDFGGGIDSSLVDGASRPSLSQLTLADKLKNAYKSIYPWMNLGMELWQLAHSLGYLFDKTPFHRPWLAWMGVDIRRLGSADYVSRISKCRIFPQIEMIIASQAMSQKSADKDPARPSGVLALIRHYLFHSRRQLLDSLKLLLPISIFFLKFLEWWYSPSSPARALSAPRSGPAIPPPAKLSPHPRGLGIGDLPYGICPLCHERLQNATALPTGYAFCYRCIYSYVEEHARCPVTLLPARIWHPDNISMAQFGKQIQSQQIPGWGAYYLDYKALKKIISSLASSQISQYDAVRPTDLLNLASQPVQIENVPPTEVASELPDGFSTTTLSLYPGQEHDPPGAGNVFHAHKAAFFFKLERELEKARRGTLLGVQINSFYLLKEGELKLRLATLLSKRKAAAKRSGARSSGDSNIDEADGVEWRAVHEGFRLLERDLSKLQVDFDPGTLSVIYSHAENRVLSNSTLPELYLARQVEVQPVFNRELIAELSDTVAACLLDLTNASIDDSPVQPGLGSGDLMLTQHIALSRVRHSSAIADLEGNLNKAIQNSEPNETHIRQLLSLAQEAITTSDKNHIIRILWRAAIEAPRIVSDVIVDSPPFDIEAIDDISGRTFLHETALSGQLRLVEMALARGVDPSKLDVYARSALHYAALKGHSDVCRALLASGAPSDALDMDNFSPIIHATVNGHLECCSALLVDGHVNPMSAQAGQDLAPLSLACKHGHRNVVLLLLAHGATSQPNSNGELPLHLAAQEGHDAICRLLLRDPFQDDIPDKYNEWTPLFHAARYGRIECVKLLLEAGHNQTALDDVGRQPVHYATWFGHIDCMHALSQAIHPLHGTMSKSTKASSISPASDLDAPLDFDLDADPIPTLSLPPPIMPFRVYGHNYLDQNHLVQIALGCPWTLHDSHVLHPVAGVQLVPRLQGISSKALPQSNPSLKLVATSNFSATDPSFNVVLPLSDDQDIFSLQVKGLQNLTLEFSVYPSFGSKAIGRAVALSHSFTELQGTGMIILPILDHRLHLIGQVSFDVCIITPFSSAGFDLSSKFETYWKSSTAPLNSVTTPARQPASRQGFAAGANSANASPALNVTGPLIAAGGTVITSSLTGEFVHLIVQVTRDLVPVVFSRKWLPVHGFDLSIGVVTYAQFKSLSQGDTLKGDPTSTSEWHFSLSSGFYSLEDALTVLPLTLGACIELAWSPGSDRRPKQDLNAIVDSVLRTVYAVSRPSRTSDLQSSRHPVFFSSYCGMLPRENHDAEASIETARGDLRQRSISGAVDFAKENNLLGVLVDARLIVSGPIVLYVVVTDQGHPPAPSSNYSTSCPRFEYPAGFVWVTRPSDGQPTGWARS
ncbi:cyclin-dependent protein kinase inhibitor [Rhizoctonia solani AG-1 IA]|uniref:Peroxisome assembly protein 12 n=1 Tax=Thanatephorus cucumeris (strain AG1-IA) TaxID=983506 RepID=L8WZQ2_THACA|nr:cyclin-dependent protein kinase inhibitor [Rhizoctonia solani AG-1 IA]